MRVMVTLPGPDAAAGTCGPAPRHAVVEAPDDARVGDLLARLGTGLRGPGASGDLSGSTPLLHGCAAVPSPAPAPAAPVRLVVAAGPDAGRCVPLPPGRWVSVGRSVTCGLTVLDPALSREHLRVRLGPAGVVVEDLGSTNGLRWADVPTARPADGTARVSSTTRPWPPGASLLVGASRLVLLLQPAPPASTRASAGRRRVTPWPREDAPLEAVPVLLATPPEPRRREVRAPSGWGWGLPLVASLLLAAVMRMPVVLLFGLLAPAMVLGHHLGERRTSRLDHAAATRRWRAERARLVSVAAEATAQELVHLRGRHPGALGVVEALLPAPTTLLWSRAGRPPEVVLGEGDAVSAVQLDGVPARHDAAPVVLDLSDPVAVVGPPQLRDGLVRSLVLQLACSQPPSRVSLLVDPQRPPGQRWDLLAWLPHTRPRAEGPGVAVRWDRPEGILLLDDVRDAPPGATTVVLEGPGCAVLHRPGRPEVRLRPSLLALPLARRLARTLAPLLDDEGSEGTTRDAPPTLGDLLPWPRTEEEVRRSWRQAPRDLGVPLGTDARGAPVRVDLARDGPHALVAGTTGSGKSELLRTLVTGLALRHPPSRLGLLLLDYKGGSSLGECAALPHTTGLVTDLDPHLAERVLVSLRAELRRREAVLARAGARDAADLGGTEVPRLVVVVDEFRVLAEEMPDVLEGLVRVAAVGRSLGVHLVLATQRPAGVVSPDLRANVNLRIALRVRDRADSLDVLDVDDAAVLPEGRPGLALLRTGADPPARLQVSPAAPPTAPGEVTWRVEEVPDAWAGWARLHTPAGPGTSGLGSLPALLSRVARQDGLGARAVWRPPLPPAARQDDARAWALADRPEQQRHELLRWDATGHVGLVGGARSGRSTTARALVRAVGPAWLYVLDPARGLEGTELRSHPGLRAWVGVHDAAQALRVLEVLDEVLDDRLARGTGAADVPVVLLLDGWDRFLDAYADTGQGRARERALRLLRDGPAARVAVVLTGDRSLLLGTVAATLAQTWVLPLHDATDLALAGLRPHQVPRHPPPGRLVRTRDGLVAQALEPSPGRPWPDRPPGPAPPRVLALPTTVEGAPGVFAVGGDEAEDLPCPTPPFLVLGPSGSGVSTALRGVASGLRGPVLRVAGSDPPDGPTLLRALDGFAGALVVDDAHLLAGSRQEDAVLAWAEGGHDRLVVAADLEASAGLFRGLVPRVARHRRGLVLRPTSPSHGALLGVRVPVGDRPVPGRGVLVERGRCTRVQVGHVGAGGVGADPDDG